MWDQVGLLCIILYIMYMKKFFDEAQYEAICNRKYKPFQLDARMNI